MALELRSALFRRRLVGLFTMAVIPVVLAQTGGADTANPPTITKATVVGASPPQVDVAPPGPLTGLVDGSAISVTVSAKPGNEGKFFGVQARLCKQAVDVKNQATFNPTQFGNCIDQPFTNQSDDFIDVAAAPQNTTATLVFRVGIGTRAFTTSLNGDTTITCGPGNPCTLWLKESFDTALATSGVAWIHYDLQYAGSGVTSSTLPTTTLPPSTTTTLPPSTTTTLPPSTTTTLPPSTTTTLPPSTTTTVPGSTTTTVPGSTTTTVPGSTTTTVPGSTTTTVPGSTTTTVPGSTTTTVPGSTTTTVPGSTTTTVPGSTTTTVPGSTTTTVPPSTTTTTAVAPSSTTVVPATTTTVALPPPIRAVVCNVLRSLQQVFDRFFPGLFRAFAVSFGCVG